MQSYASRNLETEWTIGLLLMSHTLTVWVQSPTWPHTTNSSLMQPLSKFIEPIITREQSKILTGSFDFIGVNYYTSNYAANIPHSNNDTSKSTYFKDTHVNLTSRNFHLVQNSWRIIHYIYILWYFALIFSTFFDVKRFLLWLITAERNGIPIGPRVSKTLFQLSLHPRRECVCMHAYWHLYNQILGLYDLFVLQITKKQHLCSGCFALAICLSKGDSGTTTVHKDKV